MLSDFDSNFDIKKIISNNLTINLIYNVSTKKISKKEIKVNPTSGKVEDTPLIELGNLKVIDSPIKLQNIMKLPDHVNHYILTKDIDMSSYSCSMIKNFNGIFISLNNSTIKNIKIKIDQRTNVGIFDILKPNAVLIGINLSECIFLSSTINDLSIGSVCGLNEGIIYECDIDNILIYGYKDSDSLSKTKIISGGICGINKNTIVNCNIKQKNIIISKIKGNTTNNSILSGGICGLNEFKLVNCSVLQNNIVLSISYTNKSECLSGLLCALNKLTLTKCNSGSNNLINSYNYHIFNDNNNVLASGMVGFNEGLIDDCSIGSNNIINISTKVKNYKIRNDIVDGYNKCTGKINKLSYDNIKLAEFNILGKNSGQDVKRINIYSDASDVTKVVTHRYHDICNCDKIEIWEPEWNNWRIQLINLIEHFGFNIDDDIIVKYFTDLPVTIYFYKDKNNKYVINNNNLFRKFIYDKLQDEIKDNYILKEQYEFFTLDNVKNSLLHIIIIVIILILCINL
uniref:Uncharacterized protein n=1 Tax=Megaviridae environmental sample TaxID=1737588 RepID=A0A5J6VLN1_9VIRU|nr:MAG: hypothetical protein [Megaviridae environmental sample]